MPMTTVTDYSVNFAKEIYQFHKQMGTGVDAVYTDCGNR